MMSRKLRKAVNVLVAPVATFGAALCITMGIEVAFQLRQEWTGLALALAGGLFAAVAGWSLHRETPKKQQPTPPVDEDAWFTQWLSEPYHAGEQQ